MDWDILRESSSNSELVGMTLSVPVEFQHIPCAAQLDARQLACPLPLLKARQALREVAVGQVLLVAATDPGSWRDFAAYAEQSGQCLLAATESQSVYFYWLERRI